jgi:outer membrane protein assembly factor BamB
MSPQTSAPPVVLSVEPSFALPGGEIVLNGRALLASLTEPTQVLFGESPGTIVFASATRLTVLVPDAASGGESITITTPHGTTSVAFTIGTLLSENLHPVANPAVDAGSNIYVTFSGGRGQSVPTSLFRIDDESTLHAIAAEIMNPTGLALDAIGNLYISSRHDGAVYRLNTDGDLSTYAEGMGVATGLAFDEIGNLYVGDRSGTIFKIAPDRQIFVFATIEPSVSAYHMAFSPNGNLYVTGPTTSSNDCVYEIDPHGVVSPWFSNLGRPQGIAFDLQGNLYVAASWRGHRGIIRITPERQASFIIAGTNLVGLAFDPNHALILATTSAAYFLPWSIPGFTVTPELPEL